MVDKGMILILSVQIFSQDSDIVITFHLPDQEFPTKTEDCLRPMAAQSVFASSIMLSVN